MAKANSKDNGQEAAEDFEFEPKGSPKALLTAANRIVALAKRRKAINEEILAIREDLVAKGWSKRGFDAAVAYSKLDPEKRAGIDETYAAARAQLGVGFAPELNFAAPAARKGKGAEDRAAA